MIRPESDALLALLIAGHALGDFVFQTDGMIRSKMRSSGLLRHGVAVLLCHALALAPFASPQVALAVAGLALVHILMDVLKGALASRVPSRDLEWFLLDQLLHAVTIVIAWLWLAPRVHVLPGIASHVETVFVAGVLAAGYALQCNGMAALVRHLLNRLQLLPRDGGPSVGRVIGILERVLALTLLLHDQWEALGFIVAAKSLARFKDLDDRARAEYYLVGTLLSLLGAVFTGLIVRHLLAL